MENVEITLSLPTGPIDWTATTDSYTNDIFFSINLNVNRSGNVTQTRNNGTYMELIGPDNQPVPLNSPNVFGGRIQVVGGRYGARASRIYLSRFRNLQRVTTR